MELRDSQIRNKGRRKWGRGEAPATLSAPPLTVFKQADGRYRWVLISSNAFEDRDGEIVSQKALEADVARADTDNDYGPLDWWHTPVILGDCDFNAMHGRMLVESGTFHDARVGERVKAAAPRLRVSIAFKHPATEPDAAGVFHSIRRFARSLLPAGQEANSLTAMPVVTKESETMLKDKMKALATLLGGDDELVKHVLKQAETAEKAAELAGTRTKQKAEDEDKPEGTDAAADAPFPKAEVEDDEKPEDEEKKTKAAADAPPAVIGDMTPAEFTQFLGTALKEFSDRLAAVETATTQKDAAAAEQRQALKALGGKLDAIAEAADAALTGVKELKGELPRVLGDKRTGVFRPSQDAPEPSEALKERMKANQSAKAGPHGDDPWGKHMAAIFKASGGQ